MSKINIFILDHLDNEKEEITIDKPNTYQELVKYLSNETKICEIFIYDNNIKIIIDNEDKYKLIKYTIFVKELDNSDRSISSLNYDKSSESNQNITDEKYNCKICSTIIKNEKSYLCQKCQKLFHEKCLKELDNECKLQNKNLECPNCKNIIQLENWNTKLDYEDDRLDNINILNEINEFQLNNNMNSNKNIINDKTIKEYEDYINKTIVIFKIILNKINIIHNTMEMKNNDELSELIKNYKLNIDNLNIDYISNVINEELDNIYEKILNKKHNENKMSNKISEKELFKNDINLIYYTEKKSICNIFGKDFINNNKDNVELIINGKNNKIVDKFELKEGNNIITLIIKNKLTNLSNMFYDCNNLKDIKELKHLNVNEIKDFKYMFSGCSSLEDIKPLKKWNVSNGKYFEGMFNGCSSLTDITYLKNWDVSNGSNFSNMFFKCSSLSDINALENWNLSNAKNLSYMFYRCSSLSIIKPLENWNVSNVKNFSYMFCECSFSDIKALKKWNVSSGKDFSCMFNGCLYLSDIKALKSWNVSNSKDFSCMFWGCSSLSDIKTLKNWNVSNCNSFNGMFSGCSSLSDIKPLKNWKYYKNMFDEDKYH